MSLIVLDSAPLSAFARAKRLPDLERLTAGNKRVTTQAVIDELENGIPAHPELEEVRALSWLEIIRVDSLEELRLFSSYARILGTGVHDVGEATVLAVAEAREAVAFTDDHAAVQAARARGVTTCRTLALIANGVRIRLLTELEAEVLVEDLRVAGARLPTTGREFVAWAREKGIL